MISMAVKATNEDLDWGPLPRKTKDQFSEMVSLLNYKVETILIQINLRTFL